MTLARARSLGYRDPDICLLGSIDCSGKEGPRNRKHQSAPLDDGLTDRPEGVAPNFMKKSPLVRWRRTTLPQRDAHAHVLAWGQQDHTRCNNAGLRKLAWCRESHVM